MEHTQTDVKTALSDLQQILIFLGRTIEEKSLSTDERSALGSLVDEGTDRLKRALVQIPSTVPATPGAHAFPSPAPHEEPGDLPTFKDAVLKRIEQLAAILEIIPALQSRSFREEYIDGLAALGGSLCGELERDIEQWRRREPQAGAGNATPARDMH